MTWLLMHWRAIGALLVVGALSGLALYYRGEAAAADAATARAQRDLEAMRGAYLLLAGSVQRQNDAVNEWERKAAEAAHRGAQARSEAAGAVDVAVRSAEALSRRMREPAGTNCPAGEGLAIVREDWRR
jgi:hypothetical protein